MEFKNLGRNILYRLDESRRQAGADKAVSATMIYKAFADIPTKNVTDAIVSLHKRHFLKMNPDDQKIVLTALGKDRIKALRRRLKIP